MNPDAPFSLNLQLLTFTSGTLPSDPMGMRCGVNICHCSMSVSAALQTRGIHQTAIPMGIGRLLPTANGGGLAGKKPPELRYGYGHGYKKFVELFFPE